MGLNDGFLHAPQVIEGFGGAPPFYNLNNPICNPGCSHYRESITLVLDRVTCPQCVSTLADTSLWVVQL